MRREVRTHRAISVVGTTEPARSAVVPAGLHPAVARAAARDALRTTTPAAAVPTARPGTLLLRAPARPATQVQVSARTSVDVDSDDRRWRIDRWDVVDRLSQN